VRRGLGWFVVIAAAGCDSPCDDAYSRIDAAVAACPSAAPVAPLDPYVECADEDVAPLERQADCLEAAECAAIDGSDPAGHRALSECVAGLSEPETE
jgi:hypothetical protein